MGGAEVLAVAKADHLAEFHDADARADCFALQHVVGGQNHGSLLRGRDLSQQAPH